jgi:hypothetical protein
MISIKELKMKHQYGALIHNELTNLINDFDIEVKAEARKLAKELGYTVVPDSWNTVKVYPSKGLIKTLSKLI